ncbi:hypothetical protein HID58_069991, partial [Brassica napus]
EIDDRDVFDGNLRRDGTLSPELANPIQVKTKVTIKGHLHTYRFCDNDAMFKSEDRQENVSQVKIVACDSKLLTQ